MGGGAQGIMFELTNNLAIINPWRFWSRLFKWSSAARANSQAEKAYNLEDSKTRRASKKAWRSAGPYRAAEVDALLRLFKS
jgi:hypothetical protein